MTIKPKKPEDQVKFYKNYLIDTLDNRKAKIQNLYHADRILKQELDHEIAIVDNVLDFVKERL